MKIKKAIPYILILLLISSCNNLSKIEKLIQKKKENSQKYMVEIIKRTNTNLPTTLDDYTIANEAKYNKEKKEVTYVYEIDIQGYGSSLKEIENAFRQIEEKQIKNAIKMQGKDPNYSLLGVTITCVYKNKKDEILYSFSIEPKQYDKILLDEAKKIESKRINNLFPDKDIQVSFEKGISYGKGFRELYPEDDESFHSLIINTNFTNPFNELIEYSSLDFKLILKYKKGTTRFNYDYKGVDGYIYNLLSSRNWDDFFLDKNVSLKNIQIFSNYRDYKMNIDSYSMSIKELEKRYSYTESEKENLEKVLQELFKFNDLKYSDDFNYSSKNTSFNKQNISLNLFNNFTQNEKDLHIPTYTLFKVENAVLEVFLETGTSNGFYFNKKIKSIDITNKWNKHFGFTKKSGKHNTYQKVNNIEIPILDNWSIIPNSKNDFLSLKNTKNKIGFNISFTKSTLSLSDFSSVISDSEIEKMVKTGNTINLKKSIDTVFNGLPTKKMIFDCMKKSTREKYIMEITNFQYKKFYYTITFFSNSEKNTIIDKIILN